MRIIWKYNNVLTFYLQIEFYEKMQNNDKIHFINKFHEQSLGKTKKL